MGACEGCDLTGFNSILLAAMLSTVYYEEVAALSGQDDGGWTMAVEESGDVRSHSRF